MGPRSRHTAQEGDALCLLEMNVLGAKSANQPRTTAKDLVKMMEETSTKLSISTVKPVLYRHNLIAQERSHCSKNTIKKPDYGLQLHIRTKSILFGEMSSGLIKQK